MKKNSPLRVLQVLNHMDHGGIEAVVMNYYRFMDRSRVQFDFAVSADSVLPQRKEIEGLGGRVYLLPNISHFCKYIFTLRKIIKKHSYKIIHCHMNTLSVIPLSAAYLAGTKVRICHNHTTAHRGEGVRAAAKYFTRLFGKWFATEYFACGEYAGRWMYGDPCFNAGRVYIMRNAIDIERYRFDGDIRERLREKLKLTNKFVVGHIGRFVYPKNHDFLTQIFFEIYQRNKDAVLLLVGEGELEGQIREKVKRMGIEDAVIFYGSSRNTSELYQAMDVLCLPSFYEGVPVVAIEAQGNGLPVIASDKVSVEVKISGNCEMMSLEMPPEAWAVRILKRCGEKREKGRENILLAESGFSIETEAKKLEENYMQFYFCYIKDKDR